MIVPDVNLLVYAYNRDAPSHVAARAWWEQLLNEQRPVGVPWAVAMGFVRIMTHPRVLVSPMDPTKALDHVASWLARTHVQMLEPGPRHLNVLRSLFAALGVAGSLTTDAHLAAIAMEHQSELHSNDADFSRFPGLRWHNPLVG